MKVVIKTKGRVVPKAGVRVRICGLAYYVASAEDPTEIDELTVVTECDVQPGPDGKFDGSPIVNAELVGTQEMTRPHEQVR